MGVAEELVPEDVPKRRRTDRDGYEVRLEALEGRVTAIERLGAREGAMFRSLAAAVDGLATVLTLAGPASTETKALLTALVQSDQARTVREEATSQTLQTQQDAVRAELQAQQSRREAREERLVKWARWLLTGMGAIASMMAAVIISSLPAALHIWFYPLFGIVVITVAIITSYLYIWRKRS